jgi:hypothetical protein
MPQVAAGRDDMPKTMVTIAADHLGTVNMTPAQFRMFCMAAMVGLDGFTGEEADEDLADETHEIVKVLEALA